KALRMLSAEKFAKMIAFVRGGAGRRVRTNSHVGRMNRVLRLYEKARYQWRGARSKVRFVCLLIDRRWGEGVRRWARGGSGAGRAAGPGPRPEEPVAVGPPGFALF